jgi:hypothetical protein
LLRQETIMLYWLGGVLAVCALLAAFAPRIRPAVVGAILVLCAVSIFAVRLGHEGPYPFPRGLDLAAVSASLLLALFVVSLGWNAARRGSPLLRAAFALVPIVLLLGIVAVLHEIEEVVVLRTFDDRGGVLETRLWVVDHDGAPWLLTGANGRHTLRLEARPRVEIVRHGTVRCYHAVPFRDRATIDEILRLRGEKYAVQRFGLAIGFDRIFRSRERPIESYAIAIRLDPCPPEPTGRPQGNLDHPVPPAPVRGDA